MKTATTVCTIFLLLLCSCSEEVMEVNISKIDVDFVWDLKQPQRSPEIHLKNIPKVTGYVIRRIQQERGKNSNAI